MANQYTTPPSLKFFKLDPDVKLPRLATEGSACFDLQYFPMKRDFVTGYDGNNAPVNRTINKNGEFSLMTGDRLLVPVGYIMDIPSGFSVRFHARSGLSLKNGIVLANQEAVIDEDYVEELFIMLTNVSTVGHLIKPGDRLAQAELIRTQKCTLDATEIKPETKTSRTGGYGSTGRA